MPTDHVGNPSNSEVPYVPYGASWFFDGEKDDDDALTVASQSPFVIGMVVIALMRGPEEIDRMLKALS